MCKEGAEYRRWVARISEWMAALPPGGHVGWTSFNLSAESPVASGFIDVEVPEIVHLLETGWIWGVVDTSDSDTAPGVPLTLLVPFDTAEGWTPAAISRALEEWTRAHTGRDDLHFDWDPTLESVMRWWYDDALRRTAEGREKFQISENVMASEDAFESLLEMPADIAAEIIGDLQEIAESHARRDTLEE